MVCIFLHSFGIFSSELIGITDLAVLSLLRGKSSSPLSEFLAQSWVLRELLPRVLSSKITLSLLLILLSAIFGFSSSFIETEAGDGSIALGLEFNTSNSIVDLSSGFKI